jgi:hypothetical protein
MSSPSSTSDCSSENNNEGLFNILQYNYFYHGDISDKAIISAVIKYIKLKQDDCEFQDYYRLVYNVMKPKFQTDALDETYRQLKRKHPEVDDNELFDIIKGEVNDTIVGYSTSLSFLEDDEKIKKYEETKSFQQLVNHETLRQYRQLKRQKLEEYINDDPNIIVLTGAIGDKKSKFGTELVEYLKEKGFKVYFPERITIQEELDLNLSDNALFIQNLIIKAYRDLYYYIENLFEYDYIILEGTHLDTLFNVNSKITKENELEYIKKKTATLKNIDKVLYLKDDNINKEYSSFIQETYPKHVVIERDNYNLDEIYNKYI